MVDFNELHSKENAETLEIVERDRVSLWVILNGPEDLKGQEDGISV
jgi:hypothetical protein